MIDELNQKNLSENYIQRYEAQGKVNYKGSISRDQVNGFGIEYFPNGSIKFIGNMQNGLPEGPDIQQFHTSAYLRYTGHFINGQYSGQGYLYFPNTSQKMLFATFEEGKIKEDLSVTLYHKNGNLKYHGSFGNNVRQGNGTEYHENGSVMHKNAYYENDILNGKLVETYNDEGQLIFTGDYKNGIIDGSGKEFFSDTDKVVKLFSEHFVNGLANGNKNKLYWPNGKIKYEGQMKNGNLHGLVNYFLFYILGQTLL